MNFLVKFVLDAAARKLETAIAKSVNQDMHVFGQHIQASNPAANARRRAKRVIGARQYRKQVKALRLASPGASLALAQAHVAESVQVGMRVVA